MNPPVEPLVDSSRVSWSLVWQPWLGAHSGTVTNTITPTVLTGSYWHGHLPLARAAGHQNMLNSFWSGSKVINFFCDERLKIQWYPTAVAFELPVICSTAVWPPVWPHQCGHIRIVAPPLHHCITQSPSRQSLHTIMYYSLSWADFCICPLFWASSSPPATQNGRFQLKLK